MGELAIEDFSNSDIMVDMMREVHADCVVVDVGVFGGVDPCEVMVLDEDWAVRRR